MLLDAGLDCVKEVGTQGQIQGQIPGQIQRKGRREGILAVAQESKGGDNPRYDMLMTCLYWCQPYLPQLTLLLTGNRASCWDELLSSLVQRLQALQVVSMTSCVKRRLKRAQIHVKVCPSPPSPVDTPGISRCHVCGSWKFRQISLRSICRSYQCSFP